MPKEHYIRKPLSEEHKQKLRTLMLGRKFSEETKLKMSDAKIKRFQTIITRNDCIELISHSKDISGYPMVWRNGKRYSAHRYFFEQKNGLIAKSLFV